MAHDALVAALEKWPVSGIPDNPRSWLVTVAKRRFIDSLRRKAALDARRDNLGAQQLARQVQSAEDYDAVTEEVSDNVLRLMFMCCHPVLSRDARVALTLRTVGGLTTEQIARAYVVKEATIAQRVVRAKRALAEARVRFELPAGTALADRLAPVLEVLYLTFNEGYVATSGDQWAVPVLCHEALRLGRVLAELLPGEAEAHGLVALMEIQSSRLRARVGPRGEAVLLPDQDRRLWDQLLVRRGLAALDRAAGLGHGLGPYGLQAAIAACHAQARTLAGTDWARITALYDALAAISPSPIVELNRAVAVCMAYGPQAGLDVLDAIGPHPAVESYYLFSSVRGDILEKLGRLAEARHEFERAARLTRNEPERRLLLARAVPGPAKAGPAPSGPAPSGPAPSGPAPSGPAPSGPAPSGPAPSGPAPSGPAPSGPAPSGLSPGAGLDGGSDSGEPFKRA
jgi:RNA polymerase sigma factor (sigma-70 family)